MRCTSCEREANWFFLPRAGENRYCRDCALAQGMIAAGEGCECGPKGGWLPVPQFVFKDTCCRHDHAYDRGWTKRDRKRADTALFRGMISDATRTMIVRDCGVTRFMLYALMACIYYRAVRLFGAKYFNWTAPAKSRGERTTAEMEPVGDNILKLESKPLSPEDVARLTSSIDRLIIK